MKKNNELLGGAITLLGGILWGVSGLCSQFLSQTKSLSGNWIVPFRMLSAGIIMFLILLIQNGKNTFRIWKTHPVNIILFALFGVIMNQYTFINAVSNSNAGTATVLQYTSPVMIMLFYALKRRKMPRAVEFLVIFLAVAGTFLLATHGDPRGMVLSKEALIWGLASAVAMSAYSIIPVKMLEEYPAFEVMSWGMILGGVILCAVFRPWTIPAEVDTSVLLAFSCLVLVGTIAAYVLYLEGVRRIGAKKGSLYASIEPVAATVFSVLLMHAPFTFMDGVGLVLILSTIFILAFYHPKKKETA